MIKTHENDNQRLFIIDPETGIVQDVMITYITMSGAYCFSDLQTEWASELGEYLLNNLPGWMDYTIFAGLAMGTVFTAAEATGMGATILGLVSNPVGWVIGFAIVDAYLLWNYPDMAVPANLKAIPFFGQLLALYSLQSIIKGQGEPLTPERLEQSFFESANLLMSLTSLTENEYQELYTAMVSGSNQDTNDWVDNRRMDHLNSRNEFLKGDGPKGDKGKFLKNLYDASKKRCNDGWNKLKSGDLY